MKRNLAIFDLDNTILNGDSDYSWINFLIEKGFVDKDEYERKNKYFYDQYYQGKLNYGEWAEFALTTIKGKKLEEIEDILAKFLNEVIEPMINIYALKLLHDHSHNNDIMLLASATNSVIVEPIAKRLGFKNIVSTEVEIVDELYTGTFQPRSHTWFCLGRNDSPSSFFVFFAALLCFFRCLLV